MVCPNGRRVYWFPLWAERNLLGIAGVRDVGIGPRQRETEGFKTAVLALRLICGCLLAAILCEQYQAGLLQANAAIRELRAVASRHRSELRKIIPALHSIAPKLEKETHSAQVVRALLVFIKEHYGEPVTLRQCANQLRMNAAYLSDLFSEDVGIPFKTYLTELRLEKARELLGDPTVTIAEAAGAVGYASENRFRIAFKQATGLPPRVWRETLILDRPAPRELARKTT